VDGDYCKNQSQSWEILDGIGYYMTYGQCENSNVTQAKFITDGLSSRVPPEARYSKGSSPHSDDVELPPDRLCDKLRAEQNAYRVKNPAAVK